MPLHTYASSDINECSIRNICGAYKKCINTRGSYTCICKSGYKEIRNGTCEGIHILFLICFYVLSK